jgi:predicted nucleic acid-binding protein
MRLVLDASAALAWLIDRAKPAEAQLTESILRALYRQEAVVPSLWFAEVANGILVAERQGACSHVKSGQFLALLAALPIVEDDARPSATQAAALNLARAHNLTGYDAVYLELVLRRNAVLATFDQHLAGAVRQAGGRTFGDPE